MDTHAAGAQPHDTLLKETAVAIGGVAGKLTVLAKSVLPHAESAPNTPSTRKRKGFGKLPAKDKARLPRKEKKALAAQKAR